MPAHLKDQHQYSAVWEPNLILEVMAQKKGWYTHYTPHQYYSTADISSRFLLPPPLFKSHFITAGIQSGKQILEHAEPYCAAFLVSNSPADPATDCGCTAFKSALKLIWNAKNYGTS